MSKYLKELLDLNLGPNWMVEKAKGGEGWRRLQRDGTGRSVVTRGGFVWRAACRGKARTQREMATGIAMPVDAPLAGLSDATRGAARSAAGAAGAVGKGLAGEEELREQVAELQSWDQPFASACALAAATALFYLTQGADGWSVLGLVCWVLLARLLTVAGLRRALALVEARNAPNFKPLVAGLQRLVVAVEGTLVMPSPESVGKLVRGLAALVEARSNAVFKALAEASEPTPEGAAALKKAVAHLAGLIGALWLLAPGTLLYLYVVLQLTWPAIRARHGARIDAATAQVQDKAAPYVAQAQVKANELAQLAGAKAADLGAKAAEQLKPLLDQVAAKIKPLIEQVMPAAKQHVAKAE